METAIYITEVASKYGDAWIESELQTANEQGNSDLNRMAFKMATGSGKTVVMAMLIAWNALNKQANPQDARYSDTFLIVTPGITIRDRLRVLLPHDPENYYRKWDILPEDDALALGNAKVLVTNFHTFLYRETMDASKLAKQILSRHGRPGALTETPDQMVRRACRELGNKKNIVVINDEAHHCYRHKEIENQEALVGDDRKEMEKREEEARIWINGLEAVKNKIGLKSVYDLSATPFFLKGSGFEEGTLFPWVVSDFSLIDAIESGIVKVPRVPVADDSMTGEMPTYRSIWYRIRDHLPKKGRRTEKTTGDPNPPKELEGALQSLYGNYEKYYREWEKNKEAISRGITPPVFIVVCNNTNVSKLVYDYISGWEKELKDGTVKVVPGKLPIFNNEDHGQWRDRPYTILIDSEQLESGEALSSEFKKIAGAEIDKFKDEYRQRFPGRDVDQIEDSEILREVMNTVGKAGKLGEHVRCVVSVSMLTEGWDANTVTHILGVRAFGTQLLCEQVIGRGLRRRSYAVNGKGMFEPEYAEVYGVPFSFIPCSGSSTQIKLGVQPTHVRALEERIALEITFPRVMGYRWDMPSEKLTAKFNESSNLALSTQDVPSWTKNEPIIGESSVHKLDELKNRRMQEVAFLLAKLTLEKYYRLESDKRDEKTKEHKFSSDVKSWLFPQLLEISRQWLDKCVVCKDNTFPQMLLLMELAHDASDRIYHSIVEGITGEKNLRPILRPYDTVGSTRYVDFDTIKPVYPTNEKYCHVSHVVTDTGSWEQKMAQGIEELADEGIVKCYVKNQGFGFRIPYTLSGEEHNYEPDFILRINDGRGVDDLLNLIVEVTGEKKKDKAAKTATARDFWVPAINNQGGFGRWAFLEVTDPWDGKNSIKSAIKRTKSNV